MPAYMPIGNVRSRTDLMTSIDRPVVSKGEMWLVALDPVIGSEQAKTRPCAIVQRQSANRGNTTIIVPMTATTRRPAVITEPRIFMGDGGLTKDSVALCRQVRVVDRLRMRKRLGILSPHAQQTIAAGLAAILDLEAD
jgi:mRNA interferase MazF